MRVALTFDDGPSEWTPAILDLLAEAGAHATFFVVAENAIQANYKYTGSARTMRTIVREGHEVGNHTFEHTRMTADSPAHAIIDLNTARAAINGCYGVKPNLWRAPHLDAPPNVVELAEEMGWTHVGCDIDTADWMLDEPQRIADAALRAKDGDIILMHDGIPPDGGTGTRSRQPTVDALRIILEQPWSFVTVSELWA